MPSSTSSNFVGNANATSVLQSLASTARRVVEFEYRSLPGSVSVAQHTSPEQFSFTRTHFGRVVEGSYASPAAT